MKLLAIIAAALAFIAVPAAADIGRCERDHPEVRYAIGKFCMSLGTANVVPNKRAGGGVEYKWKGGKKLTQLHIKADCKPGQWIPRGYCTSQFYRMCANASDKHGQSHARWGRNGCQRWYITNPRANK